MSRFTSESAVHNSLRVDTGCYTRVMHCDYIAMSRNADVGYCVKASPYTKAFL
jgi:hypothetical protein